MSESTLSTSSGGSISSSDRGSDNHSLNSNGTESSQSEAEKESPQGSSAQSSSSSSYTSSTTSGDHESKIVWHSAKGSSSTEQTATEEDSKNCGTQSEEDSNSDASSEDEDSEFSEYELAPQSQSITAGGEQEQLTYQSTKKKGYWNGYFFPLLRRQTLPGFRPVWSELWVSTFFLLAGAVILALGIVIVYTSANHKVYKIRYDDICGEKCTLSVNIDEKLEAPVYIFYEIHNFYQNDMRYVKSRSYDQLTGNPTVNYNSLSSCEPAISENDKGDKKSVFFPCGLIAHSLFNDTFVFRQNGEVGLGKAHIALQVDRKQIYKQPSELPEGKIIVDDITDESFIVWMRVSALADFRKPYRIYNGKPLQGKFDIDIENNFVVKGFGEKYIVITKGFWLGTPNVPLGIVATALGGFAVIVGLFIALSSVIAPRSKSSTRIKAE